MHIFTSGVSGRGYKNRAVCGCVCLSVCPCVNTLSVEPIDILSQNLVQGLTLMISWKSLMVKVVGKSSRSLGQKWDFYDFLDCVQGYKT